MRTIGWMLFFGCISSLDALRDAGYGHEHWARTPFLWTDIWHLCLKWPAFYGPLVVILWLKWPLAVWFEHSGSPPRWRFVMWHNVPRWIAAAAVGWASWWIFVRVGGAPWLQ